MSQKGSRWMGQRKQPKGPLRLPPSSPGKKGSESPTPNPMPPLTDSDSIKAKTELSPGKDKESRARPLNMHLPAFEDTFYTLPRCIFPHLPPPSRSANATHRTLKKVGELVGGVLLGKVESKPDDVGSFLIQVPALCRLRHPAYLTLCARRSLAPPAHAPTRPVTREIQSHTHSLRPTTRGRALYDGADCCHWDTRRDGYAHIIVGRRDGDKSKVCKYDEESY